MSQRLDNHAHTTAIVKQRKLRHQGGRSTDRNRLSDNGRFRVEVHDERGRVVADDELRQPLAPGSRVAGYRVVRVISRGGFGIVYEAVHIDIGQRVALKEFFPFALAVRGADGGLQPVADQRVTFNWALRKFTEEAKAVVSVQSTAYNRSIVRVLGFLKANGTRYVVMDFEEGRSLKRQVRERGTFSADSLSVLLVPLLDGLEWIHERHVLHRDIKPDNIIIRADGTPVLVDFGAAKLDFADGRLTSLVAYTEGFAPPELQTPGFAPQGPWTDIYSLVATIYYALNGSPPPPASQRVFPLPVWTPQLRRAVECGLEFEIHSRPQDVDSLRRLLSSDAGAAIPAITAPVRVGSAPKSAADAISAAGAADFSQTVRPSRSWQVKTAAGVVLGLTIVATYGLLATRHVGWRNVADDSSGERSQQEPATSRRLQVSTLIDRFVAEDSMCRRLRFEHKPDGVLELAGTVATLGDRQALERALLALPGTTRVSTAGVSEIPAAFCEVAVVPMAYRATGESLDVRFNRLDRQYRVNEFLVIDVKPAATFGGYLYVDLLDNAGNVVHLRSTAGSRAVAVVSANRIRYGSDQLDSASPRYRIVPPHGNHALLVIQSQTPLPLPTHADAESATVYAGVLAALLTKHGQSGLYLAAVEQFTTVAE